MERLLTDMNSNAKNTIGMLRAFVEASSIEEGTQIAGELTKLIDESLGVTIESVETYWKIPEWYEVMIRISNGQTADSAWSKIQPLCTNWQLSRNESGINAIWSTEIGGSVALPRMRWISVNLFPA